MEGYCLRLEEEVVEVQRISGEEEKKRKRGIAKWSRCILPLNWMEVKSVSKAKERKMAQEESRPELEM